MVPGTSSVKQISVFECKRNGCHISGGRHNHIKGQYVIKGRHKSSYLQSE